jgi:hypothetical protein
MTVPARATALPAGARKALPWALVELAVWGGWLVVILVRAPEIGALGPILGLLWAHRLAGTVGLLVVDDPFGPGAGRLARLTGWLYLSRTAALGAATLAGTIAVMVARPHRAEIIIGVIGLLVGQAALIAGIGLLRTWKHRLRDQDEAVPPAAV